jgi:hypothetical protein
MASHKHTMAALNLILLHISCENLNVYTYILFTLYPRRGSSVKHFSRHLHFTKRTKLGEQRVAINPLVAFMTSVEEGEMLYLRRNI